MKRLPEEHRSGASNLFQAFAIRRGNSPPCKPHNKNAILCVLSNCKKQSHINKINVVFIHIYSCLILIHFETHMLMTCKICAQINIE